MPLQDHFHPPLHGPRGWRGFHNAWATFLAGDLNRQLPERYFAEPNVEFGIEIDVATLETVEGGPAPSGWTPPTPALSVPFAIITDIVEIRIFHEDDQRILAGAIELVSPSNKDRPAERDAFVDKCISYLRGGAGVIVVDIVTDRRANLHDQLLERLQVPNRAAPGPLYTAAYRPVQREEKITLDIWQERLSLGAPLPTMPLWLREGLCLRVDLEATYDRTCRELRITVNGA